MNEKMTLLNKIQAYVFAACDWNLYLDTHPDCKDAVVQFDELQEQRAAAIKAYEAQFGPLTMYGNVESGCDNWKWSHGPWPWQNYQKEVVKYVEL